MNVSMRFEGVKKSACFNGANILLFFVFLFVAIFLSPGVDGSNMTLDAKNTYTQCIETGIVTDWHSALYMHEGIALKKIMQLVGVCLSGWAIIKIMSIVHLFCMFFSVCYLLTIYRPKSAISCLLAVVFSAVFLTEAALSNWGLDQSFICVLVSLIASVVALYRVERKSSRLMMWCCSIILLWHCVAFRKNSIFIVPWVMFALMYSVESFRQNSWRKMALCVMSYSLLGALCFLAIPKIILPTKSSAPQIPMMVSDLRIAYILMGKEDELLTVKTLPDEYAPWDKTITAYPRGLRKDADYKEFEKFYIDNWRNHTKEMLVSKSLQMLQFYMGGKTPAIIKKIIQKHFPAVVKNPDAWKEYKTHGIPSLLLLNRIVPLLFTLVILFMSIRFIKKIGFVKSPIDLFFVFSGVTALLYAVSFMVITPTSDDRYLMPSIVICKIIIFVWVYHKISLACAEGRLENT